MADFAELCTRACEDDSVLLILLAGVADRLRIELRDPNFAARQQDPAELLRLVVRQVVDDAIDPAAVVSIIKSVSVRRANEEAAIKKKRDELRQAEEILLPISASVMETQCEDEAANELQHAIERDDADNGWRKKTEVKETGNSFWNSAKEGGGAGTNNAQKLATEIPAEGEVQCEDEAVNDKHPAVERDDTDKDSNNDAGRNEMPCAAEPRTQEEHKDILNESPEGSRKKKKKAVQSDNDRGAEVKGGGEKLQETENLSQSFEKVEDNDCDDNNELQKLATVNHAEDGGPYVDEAASELQRAVGERDDTDKCTGGDGRNESPYVELALNERSQSNNNKKKKQKKKKKKKKRKEKEETKLSDDDREPGVEAELTENLCQSFAKEEEGEDRCDPEHGPVVLAPSCHSSCDEVLDPPSFLDCYDHIELADDPDRAGGNADVYDSDSFECEVEEEDFPANSMGKVSFRSPEVTAVQQLSPLEESDKMDLFYSGAELAGFMREAEYEEQLEGTKEEEENEEVEDECDF